MKLLLVSFIFLTINCSLSKAQDEPIVVNIIPYKKPLDIRLPIIKAIARNFDRHLLHQTPKDQPYLISIALAFNEKGSIDTVYFSKNISKRTLETIKPNDELIKKIKGLGIIYQAYTSKIVLFPILFRRMDDKGIDFQSGFLQNYLKLWPDFGPLEKRPLLLLEPYINAYYESHN